MALKNNIWREYFREMFQKDWDRHQKMWDKKTEIEKKEYIRKIIDVKT
jgi:hypothetical protein